MNRFPLPAVVSADASILQVAVEVKDAFTTIAEARAAGDTELWDCVEECVLTSANKRLSACLSQRDYCATIDWAMTASGFMA